MEGTAGLKAGLSRLVRQREATKYRSETYVYPAEQAIAQTLQREGLRDMAMLDIGVGAGRTTLHFAPLVRRYVGIDFSPEMIALARERFESTLHNGGLEVADATNLAAFDRRSFGFALFSYNGLDYVDFRGRRAALSEIRRVLEDGGWFAFSSHNPHWMGLPELYRDVWRKYLLRPRALLAQGRIRALNGRLRMLPLIEEMRRRGEGRFVDLSGGRNAYVGYEAQLEHLDAAGFGEVRAYAMDGTLTQERARLDDGVHIYYLARATHRPRRTLPDRSPHAET